MKTRMPIATISYNTDDFLIQKLGELTKAKIISKWYFIEHIPEDDEEKAHKHLYIEPAKQLQTDDLLEEFIEPVLTDLKKPLKCLHFRNSKFAEWYLYALHDKAYLASKGQSRRYHYVREQIVCSDSDELLEDIKHIDFTKFSAEYRMLNAVREGLTFEEYFAVGGVPLQQFNNYQKAWQFLISSQTGRGDGEVHE